MKRLFIILFSLIYLNGCEQPTTSNRDALTRLAEQDARYDLPKPENLLRFPDAHSPQKNYRHEWWYLTANLKTEDGQRLALQWTLFRTSEAERHWYFAHGAMADTKQHLNAFRNGREEFGNVTFTVNPFSAQIDDWEWRSSADFLPATLKFGDVQSTEANWQAELSLTSSMLKQPNITLKLPFFLQGKQGFNRKHATLNIASHYYSQPFIDVDGRIFWQGKWQSVSGYAWFDREWGSQFLAPDQRGWDWFSLRLDPNTALMVYRIRSHIEDYIYGNLMYRNGRSQILSSDDIELISITNADDTYPSVFKLIIVANDVDIEVKIVNKKQINQFGIEYFEGMATFTGSHQGEGFVEMTGYR